MENFWIVRIFSSTYCVVVFTATFLLSWLLVPSSMWYGWYPVLAVLFMASFALTVTCMVRNIKERIAVAKTYRTSLLGLIAAGIGLSALQVCGVAAPMCGASIGFGIVAAIFPGFLFSALSQWSIAIVVLSVAAQWVALFAMRCFRRTIS